MAARTSAHPKYVKSDLKDVTAAATSSRRSRWPKNPGARSDHVTRAVPRGEHEQRGGHDRAERKGRVRP